MKKFFKDTDTREGQLLPTELRAFSDGRRGSQVTDKESYFVMLCHGKNSQGWSYQITFSCCENYGNNHYVIFLFDKEDNFFYTFVVESKTVFPPVWNRQWGNIDYYDYINIMEQTNNIMKNYKAEVFDINYERKGKSVYFTKEKPEEIMKLIKEGKSYRSFTLDAEAALTNLQKT